MAIIPTGTWVEIEQIVLTPEERAPTLPPETKAVPYVMRVSGFLAEEAELGQAATIRTLIGRELRGVVRVVNPGYTHSFGETVPELLTIGTEVEELTQRR